MRTVCGADRRAGLAPTGPRMLGQSPGFILGMLGRHRRAAGPRGGGGDRLAIAKWPRACWKLSADPEMGWGCQGVLFRGEDLCPLSRGPLNSTHQGPEVCAGTVGVQRCWRVRVTWLGKSQRVSWREVR